MSIPAPAKTGLPTVGVTVFDSATVFDGLRPSDVVYRYDLPGDGIAEGWATSAVVDQIRQLAAEHWPDVDVRVDASSVITEALQRVLANKGVAAHGSAPEEETELLESPESSDVGEPAADERGGGRHRLKTQSVSFPPQAWLWAAVVLVALVCAAAMFWWWRSAGGAEQASVDASGLTTAATAAENEAEAGMDDAVPSSPASPADPTTRAPLPTVDLRHGNFSVTLPIGYQLEEGDSSVLATGADPDLRIHLAADPLYSIDRELLFDEIDRLVERDPELSEPHREEERFEYTEDPGDGSQVRWTTWVEGQNQLSVGCHTRVLPTTAQHAACTVATDSLTALP